MNGSAPDGASAALAGAALLAIDPEGLKGALLCGQPSPGRDAWLAALKSMAAPQAAFARAPAHADEEALFGGVDLAASLALGRRTPRAGLVEAARGGVLVMAMAERWPLGAAARLAQTLDDEGAPLVIACDEGEDGEAAAAALTERLGLHIQADQLAQRATPVPYAEIERARARLKQLPPLTDRDLEAICAACAAFGVGSTRAALFMLRAVRAAAALAGRSAPNEADWRLAGALVLAPRARQAPDDPAPPEPSPHEDAAAPGDAGLGADAIGERLVDAVRSALPAGFLDGLAHARSARAQARSRGAGALVKRARRGRPAASRPGAFGSGERLDLVATLRAAAPWQGLRRRERPESLAPVLVRRGDFRLRRYVDRLQTTIVFVVDASGSTALHRLGEAKGAIETLLADAYVTRARVALITFRDRAAALTLAPTRSLARAKRALAVLPGGGATPLASAIDAATALASRERGKGRSPLVVFLTDARGNIDRAGAADRARADADVSAAAAALAASDITVVLIDTAPRPRDAARELARAMRARYALLPLAQGAEVAAVVRAFAPLRS